MLDAPAKLFEDRPGARGVGVVRAQQPDQLALPRRAGRTADRAFDKRGALAAHRGGERDLGRRHHRAHFDEQFAGDVAAEQAGWPVVNRIDGGGVGEDSDDGFRPLRQFSRASPRPLRRSTALALSGVAIPNRDLVADFDQPSRDGRAHFADAGNSDAHAALSLRVPSQHHDRRSARDEKAACAEGSGCHSVARLLETDKGSSMASKGVVGVVGLGIMGGSFAQNLVAAGWRVIGYDVAPQRRRALAKPVSRSQPMPSMSHARRRPSSPVCPSRKRWRRPLPQ